MNVLISISAASTYRKYRNIDSISIYRIVSPAEISKFSIYRYHIFDISFSRIFIYSFIHSRLGLTVTHRVSEFEVVETMAAVHKLVGYYSVKQNLKHVSCYTK